MNQHGQGGETAGTAPLLPRFPEAGGSDLLSRDTPAIPPRQVQKPPLQRKNGSRVPQRREIPLPRDALFIVRRNGEYHVVAESYFYKTEPYYTILSLENEGKVVHPSSSSVLDAYVIPVCLEKVRPAGIAVCEWGISQAYVPLPALLYGLNYYATSEEYAVVKDSKSAKDMIRHITNNGKYPFCFQKFPEGSEIISCTAIFGKTLCAGSTVAGYADAIYRLFGIPLFKLVCVKSGESCALSSLSPVRYAELTDGERSLLSAYLSNQEFL